MSIRNSVHRIRSLIGLGIRRFLVQARQSGRRRIRYTVFGIALAIALLVIVTGIGLGLAVGTTVYDDEMDYWLVPADDGEDSPLVDTGGPQFADAHEAHTIITETDGVDATTPVLSHPHLTEANNHSEYLLVHGIINSPELESFTGVSPDGLPSPPEYTANQTTGTIVLTEAASNQLAVEPGDNVTIDTTEFTIVAVDEGSGDFAANLPVALLPLSDMQELMGATANDQADQFVVQTTDPAVEETLADLYPNAEVETRGSMTVSALFDEEMALALALTAVVISVVVGTLFVGTVTGLEIASDRSTLQTLSAIGISVRSQLLLISTQMFGLTIAGGILGSLLGLGGIYALNTILTATIITNPVAYFHPLLAGYGLLVTMIIALLALPAIWIVLRRLSGGVPA